jgi:hypothetical protein
MGTDLEHEENHPFVPGVEVRKNIKALFHSSYIPLWLDVCAQGQLHVR